MTYPEFRAAKYFPALDGVRAISVLLVVSVHVQGNAFGRLAGYLGVTLFFIISGFLITTLALREEEANGRLNLKAFYIRRSFRIFPLYYVGFLLYFVMFGMLGLGEAGKKELFNDRIPAYLFYVQEVPHFAYPEISHKVPFHHTWSLGIEEKFYLVWPLLCFVLLYRLKELRLLVALSMTCLFGLMPILTLYGMPTLAGCLTPYHHILIGCTLAIMMHDARTYEQMRFLGKLHFVYSVFAVLIIAQLTMPYSVRDGFGAGWQSVYGLLAALFIAVLFMRDRGPILWLLSTRALVGIGTLSYGIYLFHLLPLGVVQKKLVGKVPEEWLPYAAFAGGSLGAILVAAVLHRLIEKPAIRWGRAWAAKSMVRTPAIQQVARQ
jgi:peptidoglycan/LPS O-acetylase OafA/YrhL